jgi:hypothetical protein
MPATIKVQGTELSQALFNAALFACKDATLPVICRVALDWTDAGVCAVATDRRNLARQDLESAEVSCDRPGLVTIDMTTAKQVWSLKGKPSDAPTVITIDDDGTVTFACPGDVTFTSTRLADCGGFPNWRYAWERIGKATAGPDKPGAKAPARQRWTAAYLAQLAKVKGTNGYVTLSSAASKPHTLATFHDLPLAVAMMRAFDA